MTSLIAKLSCCRLLAVVCLACVALVPGIAASEHPGFSLGERIECQRAVEEVLWRQRIWPEQNPDAKPSLAEVLPEEVLRLKVDDTLRLTAALAERWQRPITQADLQAELDRIVAESQAPDMLDKMMLALGYDATMVAECLVRPLLADRLARAAFAGDESIHGTGRRQAETDLRRFVAKAIRRPEHGQYSETEWVRYGQDFAKFERLAEAADVPRVFLSPSQWQGMVGDLESVLANVPSGELAPLQEAEDRWWSAAVLEAGDGRHRVVHLSWPKVEFDGWWAQARGDFEPARIEPGSQYSIGLFGKAAPAANSWTATAIDANTPSARELHTAVWTGAEMLVFGGLTSQGISWNGGRYSPATNSWSAMNSGGSTIGSRTDHTAVWSGSKMIVWGGWSNGELDTGGRYDPTTNGWDTTTTTGAPSARRYHGACWTGSSMLVWGGWSGTFYIGTGAEYFSGNSWTTLPTGTAGVTDPSPRADHIVASIGGSSGYVVIWGGQDGAGALADGRRLYMLFNPPRWQELTATGAPSARYDHTAVAMDHVPSQTDSRVLIWGGTANGTGGLITGGAYSAVYNNWEPVTPSGAASSRWGHQAVWTDRTMIVWGGEGSAGVLRSGGVYNYFNQKWQATTVTGAPTARIGHAVAYRAQSSNNGQFVVWGGDAGGVTDTGGVYLPPSDYQVTASKRYVYTISGAVMPADTRVFVNSLNGFSGAVSLAVAGSPPMVTTFATNPVSPATNGNGYSDVTYSVGAIGTGDIPFEFVGSWGGQTRAYDMTLRVQDFDFACDPAAVSAAPGEDAVTTCTVSSVNGFQYEVELFCTNFSCTFDPATVSPPAGGEVTSELTIHVGDGQAPGSYQVEVLGSRYSSPRFFNLDLEVLGADHIFSDGFESGTTSAWN